jgi:hypothetical protein
VTSSENLRPAANKDLSLKLLLKPYLQGLGYICEIEVDLADKNYQITYKREQLTDIDLIAFKVEGDFNFRWIASECKSGDQHAFEELVKLKGVMAASSFDRGYFIKSKVHENARLAANRLNIACLDERELRELIAAWGFDAAHILKVEKARYEYKRKCDSIVKEVSPKFVDYLRFEYWNVENYRNIPNILFLLESNREKLKLEAIAHRFFLHRVLHLFTVSLLRVCSRIYNSNLSDPGRGLQVELFGGPRDRRDREVLQDNINRVLAEVNRGPMGLDQEWMGDLSEIVARLIKSARFSTRIPRLTIDFLDHAFYLDEVKTPEIFAERHNVITIKLAQDIVQFLTKVSRVPEKAFREFMAL